MKPTSLKPWREIPNRGQSELKSNSPKKRYIVTARERWINIIGILIFGGATLATIFVIYSNYQTLDSEIIGILILFSIIGLFFTVAIVHGTIKFGGLNREYKRMNKNKKHHKKQLTNNIMS